MPTRIEENPLQTFRNFSAAFIYAVAPESPSTSTVHRTTLQMNSLSPRLLCERIREVIHGIFSADNVTSVSAKEMSSFMQSGAHYITSRKDYCDDDKKAIIKVVTETLFKDHLCFSPEKLIETLLEKDPSTLSVTEINLLTTALKDIDLAHTNFRNSLYHFYFSYLEELLIMTLLDMGCQPFTNSDSSTLTLDWGKVSFPSAEAVILASKLDRIRKGEKLVTDTLKDLFDCPPSRDQEYERIFLIFSIQLLLENVNEINSHVFKKGTFERFSFIPVGTNPFCRKAFVIEQEFRKRRGLTKDRYTAETVKKEVQQLEQTLKTLICSARCYQDEARFSSLKKLYADGVSLAIKSYGYTAEGMPQKTRKEILSSLEPIRLPQCFANDALCIVDIATLNKIIPTFSQTKDLICKQKEERFKDIISLLFQDPTEVKKFLRLYFTQSEVKKFFRLYFTQSAPYHTSTTASPDTDTSQTFVPPHLLRQTKQKNPSVIKVRKALKKLSLASPSPSEEAPNATSSSLPPTAPPPASVEKQTPINSSPAATTSDRAEAPKRDKHPEAPVREISSRPLAPPPAQNVPNPFIGSEREILAALNFPPVVAQYHVLKRFANKEDLTEERSDDLIEHTFPLFIARLIQRYTPEHKRYSPHREQSDAAYSCFGSWSYYGGKPHFGRFTEGFFSQDNRDGKKGRLFHHCIKKSTSEECFTHISTTGSYYEESDFQETAEQQESSALPQRRDQLPREKKTGRYKVTMNRYSIIVDDTVEKIIFTLGFPDGITF